MTQRTSPDASYFLDVFLINAVNVYLMVQEAQNSALKKIHQRSLEITCWWIIFLNLSYIRKVIEGKFTQM